MSTPSRSTKIREASDTSQHRKRTESTLLSNSRPRKRAITVYDAVAGRIGSNGFLNAEQLVSNKILPLSPDAVLLRPNRSNSALPISLNQAEAIKSSQTTVHDSEMLSVIHTYASDFYEAATLDAGQHDYRSFDETALIAVGILLEEATRQALAETGDMTLVEPENLAGGLPETEMVRYQVSGRVDVPSVTNGEHTSGTDEEDVEEDRFPARKRRR